jgi:hypothetical protein
MSFTGLSTRQFNCSLLFDIYFAALHHPQLYHPNGIWWRVQIMSRSQWPRRRRHRSSAARLPRLWVRIPPMNGCLLWVLCVVSWKSLQRADHSSRGVVPTVVRRCVWFRNLVNEEAMAHWGTVAPKTKNKQVMQLLTVQFCQISCDLLPLLSRFRSIINYGYRL